MEERRVGVVVGMWMRMVELAEWRDPGSRLLLLRLAAVLRVGAGQVLERPGVREDDEGVQGPRCTFFSVTVGAYVKVGSAQGLVA
jgi:hypothetical protein